MPLINSVLYLFVFAYVFVLFVANSDIFHTWHPGDTELHYHSFGLVIGSSVHSLSALWAHPEKQCVFFFLFFFFVFFFLYIFYFLLFPSVCPCVCLLGRGGTVGVLDLIFSHQKLVSFPITLSWCSGLTKPAQVYHINTFDPTGNSNGWTVRHTITLRILVDTVEVSCW